MKKLIFFSVIIFSICAGNNLFAQETKIQVAGLVFKTNRCCKDIYTLENITSDTIRIVVEKDSKTLEDRGNGKYVLTYGVRKTELIIPPHSKMHIESYILTNSDRLEIGYSKERSKPRKNNFFSRRN